MNFAEIEALYRSLRAQHAAGTLSEADFKAQLQDLMIEDDQGRWWIIGYETGQWYVHDGEQWAPGEPPRPPKPAKETRPELPQPQNQRSGPAPAVETPPAERTRPGCTKVTLRLAVTIGALAVVAGIGWTLWGNVLSPGPAATPTRMIAQASPTSGNTAAASGKLQIAILAPLSGPVPAFGVMTRDGALLAIEEWNAKGGVLGKEIVPIIKDSQCTADPAVNAARQVIYEDKVKFIVGEVCSSASIPISEIANAEGVLQISPASTNPNVTTTRDGVTKDYIFRAGFIDSFQGRVGARFALNELQARNAFVLAEAGDVYSQGLAEVFIAEFEAGGGSISRLENFQAGATDFAPILARIAAAKPDIVYLSAYYNSVNLVTRQAKEKGISTIFLGGDGWNSTELDLRAAAGGFFTDQYAPDATTPAALAFQKAFSEHYKKVPDTLAALAYDATNILLQSIQEANSADPARVKHAVARIRFVGVTGVISFDAQHNPVKSATIMEVTETGVKFKTMVNP